MEIVLADERETTALSAALAMLGTVPIGQLDLDKLIEVHRVLLSPTHPHAGLLREGDAVIGLRGRVHKVLPAPVEAQKLARQAMRWLNEQLVDNSASTDPVILAADIMFLLTQAHPFIDGNGRVARVVADWVLIRAGYTMIANPRKYFRDRAVMCFEAHKAYEGWEGGAPDPGPWHAFFGRMVMTCFRLPGTA